MLRRFGISVGSRLFSAVTQAVFLFLLARILAPAGMGLFGATLGIGAFMLAIVDWGMTTRALRLEEDAESRSLLGVVAVTRAASSVVLPLLAAIFATSLSLDTPSVWIVIGASLFALGESSGEVANGLWQGRLQPGRVAIWTTARRLLTLAPLAIAPTLTTALIGAGINGLLGTAALITALWARTGRPMAWRPFVRGNATFAITALGPQISQLDSSAVGSTSGAVAAGYYTVAARLNAPLNIIISTVVQVFVPVLARQHNATERLRLFTRTRWGVIALALLVASGATVATPLTILLFGAEYEPAAPIVAGVFVGSALSGISQFHLAWFYGTSVPKIVPAVMIVWAVCSLLIISTLGVIGGATGLGIAYALSQALLTVTLWVVWVLYRGRVSPRR